MKYFDVHTHTNYSPLDSQAAEIADECKQRGVSYIDIGTNVATSALAVKHSQDFHNVYACVGIHPNDIDKVDINVAMGEIQTLLEENKNIVAIGETGLDYHYEGYHVDSQRHIFIEHIKLAHQYRLPLMVHIRDAHEDAIKILKEHAKDLKVIIHCFTGHTNLVKQYIDMGCYISINGVVTFNSAKDLKEALKVIPLNKLLSETDAPWLSPEPFRGKVNTPLNISYVVKAMADILQISEEKLGEHLYKNAIQLFNIPLHQQ